MRSKANISLLNLPHGVINTGLHKPTAVVVRGKVVDKTSGLMVAVPGVVRGATVPVAVVSVTPGTVLSLLPVDRGNHNNVVLGPTSKHVYNSRIRINCFTVVSQTFKLIETLHLLPPL